MKRRPSLSELAHLIQEAQSLDEFWGSLRIWAGAAPDPLAERADIADQVDLLNYRQKWAVNRVDAQGRITTNDIAQRFEIGQEAARLDIHRLVGWGMLAKIGDKRGSFYIRADQAAAFRPTDIPEGVSDAIPQALLDTPSHSYMNTEV